MTGPLYLSYQPGDRHYGERLRAYLTERGLPTTDRIDQARAVVVVGDVLDPADVAYARQAGKAVHEVPAATVASGWLPGDDFIAAVGGAVAAGAMPSASMYADAADLVLDRPGDRLLAVMKTVQELTGAALADARDLVDGAPSLVLRTVRKHLAELVAEPLTQVGATVRVVPSGTVPEAAAMAGTLDAEALAAVMGKRYDLVVDDAGPNKVKVIGAVRRLTDLSMTEAKDLVSAAPGTVLSQAPWQQVQRAAVELRQLDARVSVR
jgi:large subunit ribosomal protein L7/L12